MIELNHAWTKLLPLAFLKVWALPKKSLNISPFEAMYGRPIVPLGLSPSQNSFKLPSHLPFPLLAQIRDALWQHMDDLLPRPHPNLPYPSLQIGDKVYMTTQSHSDLTPKWQVPYTVILLTPTTAKFKEITPWVHITRLKNLCSPMMKMLARLILIKFLTPAPTGDG